LYSSVLITTSEIIQLKKPQYWQKSIHIFYPSIHL